MAARCGLRVDSSGSRCVNAVEGSLTHVNRRLRLCHRPPSSSKRVRTVGIGGEVGAHFPLERSDRMRSVGAFLARAGEKKAKRRPRRATTLTRRRHNRRRTHRRWRCLPSGESSGDANPTPFGEYHPPRATRDAQSRRTLFTRPSVHVSAARSPPISLRPVTGWLPASVSARCPRARVSPPRAPAPWSSARPSPLPSPSWSSAKVRLEPNPFSREKASPLSSTSPLAHTSHPRTQGTS